jgi:hypothetical protein
MQMTSMLAWHFQQAIVGRRQRHQNDITRERDYVDCYAKQQNLKGRVRCRRIHKLR